MYMSYASTRCRLTTVVYVKLNIESILRKTFCWCYNMLLLRCMTFESIIYWMPYLCVSTYKCIIIALVALLHINVSSSPQSNFKSVWIFQRANNIGAWHPLFSNNKTFKQMSVTDVLYSWLKFYLQTEVIRLYFFQI